MRTLNVSISDKEYNQLGLTDDKLSFPEFVNIVSKELVRQAMEDSLNIAEKHGLSQMTMEEITQEVKAARKHAKDNN